MSRTSDKSECQPLIEACTLDLYQKNIFRITGLPVDATPKEVARQAQRMQMLEEVSGGAMTSSAFPLNPPPTAEQIRSALARMKEPEHRLVDEFFWYWPEAFGDSKNDPAMQALLAGDGQKALDIWIEREAEGSISAKHNLAVMFHMYAVDWTKHQLVYEIEPGRADKIKAHWTETFQHWEKLADSDDVWDVVKARVKTLEDEALTLGFVRRMRKLLPQALDRINAEAALKFAELGGMDWAEYHVDLMRQTHQGLDDVDATAELVLAPTKKRVEQRLLAARNRSQKHPEQGVELAKDLMLHCKPLMALFDLFHGADSHHRADLFDEVAQTVVEALVDYQKATGDNRAFVALLEEALVFASGTQIRERIIKNISIGQDNLSFEIAEPIFKSLSAIQKSEAKPRGKLKHIKDTILPKLPELATKIGSSVEVYNRLADSVAIVLREISIDAHNEHQDFETAQQAIQLALKLSVDTDLKKRIMVDGQILDNNKYHYDLATSEKKAKRGCQIIGASTILGGIVGAQMFNSDGGFMGGGVLGLTVGIVILRSLK